MQSLKLAAVAVILVGFTIPSVAEERREAAAHQHGQGTLYIAIDGDKAGFEMRVPGADVVGFEHAANTDAEKTALAAAKEFLGAPLKVVKLPKAANCVVEKSFVHYTKDPEHAAHHEKEHDKEHHSGHHGKHHEGHAGHQEGHAEFHVGFELTCLAPENLKLIQFGYFDQFPNAQSLQVKIATGAGQKQVNVTRQQPTLDLDAAM